MDRLTCFLGCVNVELVSRRGFSPIIVTVIVLVVGIAGYLVLNQRTNLTIVTTPVDKVFQSAPQFVTVRPVKSKIFKTEVIGEKGGSLNLEAGQQGFTLDLPENALLSDEEIRAQPLNGIDGLAEGSKFVAGVELTPDGLGFVNGAVLKIKLRKGTATENLAAFAYDEGGKFYFQPFILKGDTAEISVDGFSGGGVIDIPGNIPIVNPGSHERTAKQLLADVARRAKGNMTPELLSEARGILNAWYKYGVKVDLKKAEKDDGLVDGAIEQMLSWRSKVQLFVLDEHFEKEFEESLNSSARGVKHGVYQSDKRCLNQKDPKQVVALLRWLKITQLLGLDGRGGLKEGDIQKKAKDCLVFELKMNSTITVPSLTMKATAALNGVMRLAEDFTHFEGGGQVHEDGLTYSNGREICRTQPINYEFAIKDTKFNVNLHKKSSAKVDLVLDLGNGEQQVALACGGSGVTTISAPWSAMGGFFPGFPPFHADELVAESQNTFLLGDWEIVGSKDVYARRVYKRTVGGATEDTTLTLKHTPRK